MKKIGIVGLGIMGHGMAINFQKHGIELYVWNRTPDKASDLVRGGAVLCSSPKEVAERADIVFEVTADDSVSRSLWFGDTGILGGSKTESILITSSTLSLAYVDELIAACTERQRKFLDMPLTGSRFGAENGKLRILAGGDKATVDAIRSELAAISDKVYYFGPSGSGMRFKLILNLLLGIHMDAAVQAKELARRSGLDPMVVRDAIFDAPMGAASQATDMGFKGVDPPDHVNWAAKWTEKDLRYAKAMAERYEQDIDLLNATQQDYARLLDKGLGDCDWSQIAVLFSKGE